MAEQLAAFAEQLTAQTKLPRMVLETWPQAFQILATALPLKGKVVLLLDEISWMAAGDKDFAGPGEPLAAAIPGGQLVTLRNVDHFATPESFGFIDAALEFIDAVPA